MGNTKTEAPEGTFLDRPFVSYDGVDGNGVRAEVVVRTGCAVISDSRESDSGKSRFFEFTARSAQYTEGGWTSDPDVIQVAEQSMADGVPLYLRIEQQRKKGVPRDTPMVALRADMSSAKKSTFRALVAVRREGDDKFTVDRKTAVTDPREDDKFDTNKDFRASEQNLADTPAPSVVQYGNSGRPPSGEGMESSPWATFTPDGAVRPVSYASIVPVTVLSFVMELEADQGIGVDQRMAVKVTHILVEVMNRLQVAVFDGTRTTPDMSAASHARARAVVFMVVRNNLCGIPVPVRPEDLSDWATKVYEKSLGLWRWSMKLVSETSTS